ncbi:DnaJ domain-containing protein [Bradyrhizobium sp. CSA112]|uniref:J domain-containing protein n=1 Tax=Bradyrhizobium sp. CSA112 TaxID=2699170 RepID=UPI0023AF6392|nr:J domain-containing protein [Bradyrhizobium sp. CSA112]MDE5453081.1 DnaJ domain-containing protein [Bradyrhizobium sp. CSA112]
MGTLYDLLGALPSDDAEGLRTAFRKAAKATHPDMNPDNPDAALRFRELMRAYDILTDTEQRATYDHLLAIALQPPATPATRTYETMRKAASNTMAATIISAVLVGGYTLFGLFSKPPGAAEMVTDRTAGGALEVAALQPEAPAQDEPRVQREGEASTGAAVTMAAAAPAAKEAGTAPIGRFEPVPGFVTYNLGVQYYPRFAAAYFDRGVVLYRIGDFDRPHADIAPAKRPADLKRTKTAAPPVARKPLTIVPTLPERREPITAALTN